MARTPRKMTQAEFDAAVKELKMAVNGLHALLNEQLPDGFDPASDPMMATGSVWRNPRLEVIGRAIRGVTEWFDHLQERLGLPPGEEPKFSQRSRQQD